MCRLQGGLRHHLGFMGRLLPLNLVSPWSDQMRNIRQPRAGYQPVPEGDSAAPKTISSVLASKSSWRT